VSHGMGENRHRRCRRGEKSETLEKMFIWWHQTAGCAQCGIWWRELGRVADRGAQENEGGGEVDVGFVEDQGVCAGMWNLGVCHK